MKRSKVPCDGCVACCRNEVLFLHPEHGDQPEDYETQVINGQLALRQKPNGDCHYLGEAGCTIHDRAPIMCQAFDCRMSYLRMTALQRKRGVRAGFLNSDQLAAARSKLHTLSAEEKREAIKSRRSNRRLKLIHDILNRKAR